MEGEYFYCNQKDESTNQRGWFLYHSLFPYHAISPVFDDAVDLYKWMQGSFELKPFDKTAIIEYKPFRVKRISNSITLKEQIKKNLKQITYILNPEKECESKIKFYPPDKTTRGGIIPTYSFMNPLKKIEQVVATSSFPSIKKGDKFIELIVGEIK